VKGIEIQIIWILEQLERWEIMELESTLCRGRFILPPRILGRNQAVPLTITSLGSVAAVGDAFRRRCLPCASHRLWWRCCLHRYMEIPLISRLYLTGAFLTTAACAVDIVSPFSLYFNWDLVFSQGQVWRLVTRYEETSLIHILVTYPVFFGRPLLTVDHLGFKLVIFSLEFSLSIFYSICIFWYVLVCGRNCWPSHCGIRNLSTVSSWRLYAAAT
jgi:hypothetical protein